MRTFSILCARLSKAILNLKGRGGSYPGSLALKIDKNILTKLKYEGPIILVTGTNGKTSTANMICDLLANAGYQVISNRKGDNMMAGIATTIVSNTSLSGKVKANAIVLEVDELNIRHIFNKVPVKALVVTNFFRDQLDRAKEMELLINSIENAIINYDKELVLNANDPNVLRLALKANKAHVTSFGMSKNKYSVLETKEANEGKFCPKCGAFLKYDYYQYSHIGKFSCTKCDFKTPILNANVENVDLDDNTFMVDGHKFNNPYEGMYSIYNAAAVIAIAKYLNIDFKYVDKVFANAPKPKGRNEKFISDNKTIVLNLVKNPTGANEVMKVVEKDKEDKSICLILNNKPQDGVDVSWIYDTNFEKLFNDNTKEIICSGLRKEDMALRLYYGGYKGDIKVVDTIDEAVKMCLNAKEKSYFITTYTALMPTREVIVKEIGHE